MQEIERYNWGKLVKMAWAWLFWSGEIKRVLENLNESGWANHVSILLNTFDTFEWKIPFFVSELTCRRHREIWSGGSEEEGEGESGYDGPCPSTVKLQLGAINWHGCGNRQCCLLGILHPLYSLPAYFVEYGKYCWSYWVHFYVVNALKLQFIMRVAAYHILILIRASRRLSEFTLEDGVLHPFDSSLLLLFSLYFIFALLRVHLGSVWTNLTIFESI